MFLKNKNKPNKRFILARLQDRGIFKNISNYRKRVFRVYYDIQKSTILIKFIGSKYKELFEKNVNGLICANNIGVNCPTILNINRKTLTIMVSDVGDNILDLDTNKLSYFLNLAIKELYKFNKGGEITRELMIPRYLEAASLIEIDDITKKFPKFFEALKSLNNKKMYSGYGFGIEDPSPSNFCYSNGSVYLIDYDHFSENVNIFYEIGFLLADLLVRLDRHFLSVKELGAYVNDFIGSEYEAIPDKINKIQFFLGIVSNFATLLIDAKDDFEKYGEKVLDWENEITLISIELKKTMDQSG